MILLLNYDNQNTFFGIFSQDEISDTDDLFILDEVLNIFHLLSKVAISDEYLYPRAICCKGTVILDQAPSDLFRNAI